MSNLPDLGTEKGFVDMFGTCGKGVAKEIKLGLEILKSIDLSTSMFVFFVGTVFLIVSVFEGFI